MTEKQTSDSLYPLSDSFRAVWRGENGNVDTNSLSDFFEKVLKEAGTYKVEYSVKNISTIFVGKAEK